MSEERKCSTERTDRMRVELESMDVRLEEERKRSADLLLQVHTHTHKGRNFTHTHRQKEVLTIRHSCFFSSSKLMAPFPLQVNLLQKSLLSQNEEKRRMAVLEQQVVTRSS